MDAVKAVLLAVRFGLEVGALVALGYWGLKTGGSTLVKVVLGIGAPLVAIVLWSLFVSPKATYENEVTRALFELLVFAAAVAALVAVDRSGLAIAFAAVALVDSVLVRLLDA